MLRGGLTGAFGAAALRPPTRSASSHIQPIAFATVGDREANRKAPPQREPGGGGRNAQGPPGQKAAGPREPRRPRPAPVEEPVRLAKALADAGIASRRASEGLIAEGRVRVNGKVITSPATNVTCGKDVLEFDGKKVGAGASNASALKKFYFALHKPRGYLCSNEKGGDKLVLDLFTDWVERWKERNESRSTFPPRLFTVGRLDVGTSGLIFVTNDGDWCQRISHPSSQVSKEYVLRAEEHVTKRQIETILAGCTVDGAHVKPRRCETIANLDGGGKNRIMIEVMDGRNREVRKLAENAGVGVASLKRTRIGTFKMPFSLKAGQYQELSPKEAVGVIPQ